MGAETLGEYLEQEKRMHRLTWGDVIYLLEQDNLLHPETPYRYRPIPTFVPFGRIVWPDGEGAEMVRRIRTMHKEGIPYHFVYIKFYKDAAREGPFALVAGKTNLRDPDFSFDKIKDDYRTLVEPWEKPPKGRRKKNNAKVFLTRYDGSWYCQEVLAVWSEEQKGDMEASPKGSLQAKRALSVERDIGGLLGLFSS